MFWLILGYNPARDLTPPQGPEETRLQATAKTGTGDPTSNKMEETHLTVSDRYETF